MKMENKNKLTKKQILHFRVHIPALLKEVADCGLDERMGALKIPLNELRRKLILLSQISIRINDDELNLFMLENALYEEGDPYSKDYNPKCIEELKVKLSIN